ncbi:MAG: hypothetical protein O9318_09105 [Hylemonella sp.]|uniref:hypothetical protein n=1 Tax=Hylemonella sp. TaxID=2066020 RepID=UPI0022C03739|nr:hypothetical protein [Hylemonella sp.]MCZ8252614.1 hypothetical protein [Hylemonella sp.]
MSVDWKRLLVFWGLAAAGLLVSAQGAHEVSLECGGTTVVLTCGRAADPDDPGDPRACNDNKLTFKLSTGGQVPILPPQGFDASKTPVAMSCDVGKGNGKNYVSVEFNNGHRDCLPCMTYHLFDPSGRRLTADKTNAMRQLGEFSKKVGGFHYGKPVVIEK